MWKVLAVAALLGVAAILVSGCSGAKQLLGQTSKPDVISADATVTGSSPNFTVVVKCTVKNKGKAGWAKVTATLIGSAEWREDARAEMAEEETKVVEITFAGVDLASAGVGKYDYRYGCSAEPDQAPAAPSE
jgi:hypothetical protein